MSDVTHSPWLVLALTFVVLWLSEFFAGSVLKKATTELDAGSREDFAIILSATLTLLGLLIGFSFSMAISRYDQRKNYEEAEANAIGTEYLRAGLLPAGEAAKARALLREYLDERVLFYTSRDGQQLQRVGADTAQLQQKLWSLVQAPALSQPTPVMALVVSGMNDVLNSQGYTQAAWWNRIPAAAWAVMAAIAVSCNVLVGYGARRGRARSQLLLVLPVVVSVAFYLIADLDSPRSGIIRVQPQNLLSLSQSLTTQ
jgi:hypothetical protein